MAKPVRSFLEKYQLTDEDSNQQISDRHLEELSRTHCSKWRRLPAHLNMDTIVEEDIDRKASAEDEKRHKFFKQWKERSGSDATYQSLMAALLKIDCKNDAEYVCELLQSELKPASVVPIAAAPKEENMATNEAVAFAKKDLTSTSEESHNLESLAQSLNIGEEKQLPIQDLDSDTRRELIMQLESNRDEIQAKYAAFVDSLCEAIVDKKLTLKRFQLYLLSISAYESRHNGEQPILLDNVKDRIKEAGSIIDIFQILVTDCCSFINIGIFESIIQYYDVNTSSHHLQYSQHLKKYLNSHRISEFIAINPKLKEVQDKEKMILKFDVTLSNKITKVFDLQRAIAKILRVKPCALRLLSIEEGCVIVTFSIPTAVAKSLFASGLTSAQEADIRAQSVLWLKCGSYTLNEVLPSSHITPERTCDLIGENIASTTPELEKKGVKIVVAGKHGAGKSSLINNIFNLEENIDPTTPTCSTKQIAQHGITIQVLDTPEEIDEMKRQLKTSSKHAQADLLVYCLSIGSGSEFIEDPTIMQSLQDIYGTDIWKHCVVALTFSNVAFDFCESRTYTNPDQSSIKYKKIVNDTAARFQVQLKRLGVQDIDVKSIFEASKAQEGTIIAIPTGDEDKDQVLPGIVRKGDEEGWKGHVFLEMLKKCSDNHRADLLQYRYSHSVMQKILQKQEGIEIRAGGAGIVVGAGLGGVLGALTGPGMILGGMIGAGAGIVAGVILGATAAVKKERTKES